MKLYQLKPILLIGLSSLAFNACKKDNSSQSNQTTEWRLSPENTFEVPLSSLKTSANGSKEASVLTVYGCGSSLNGSYGGTGYYKYPDISLDFTSSAQGTTINVTVNSYDIPNRFTIKNSAGVTVATSPWKGYVTYSGP
ncbi:MAG: hypothetical protein JSS98_01375 [Bacteroidetes bacterium]|nr:hypothetical protein [Bacteroidota bacterium]MBS1735239.1 hypothetical protein [Bacteroidota bacterium]